MSDSNQAQEESFSTEKLTVTGSSTLSDLTVTGPATFAQLQSNSIFLPSTTPANTATRLYNTAGDLYWNGSLIAGAGIGNWNTDGTNAWRATGNVGIGTTTPNVKLHVGTAADATFAGTEVIFASDDNAPGGLEVRNTFRGTFNDSRVSTMADDGSYITLAQPSTLNIFSIFGLERASTSLLFNFAGSEGGAARDMAIGTFDSADLIFGTANAERLRITDAGNVGIGTTAPSQTLDIGAGSMALLTTTSATTGIIFKGADRFIHNFALPGTDGQNTFVGINAGNFTMTGSTGSEGSYNTAIGQSALLANTTGGSNTAIGRSALLSNTTGDFNTGIGLNALFANTTGDFNTANGVNALFSNTTGGSNTAFGQATGFDLTTGANNTIIGQNTGRGLTTGNNNTILGANVTGLAAGLANNIIIADGSGNRRINVDASGNVGIGTTSPTDRLTLGNASTGLAIFNTADQTTNFEKFFAKWDSNIMYVGNQNLGTGVSRPIRFGMGATNTSNLPNRYLQVQGGMPFFSYDFGGTGLGGSVMEVGGGGIFVGSSVDQIGLTVNPNVNQTGSASYTGLNISPTEITTGSGLNYLIRAGVGAANDFVMTTAGKMGIGPATPTATLHLKAGTASASSAPIKLTSGTLMTTPEAGAIEFLTDAFHATITTGAARRTFAFLESPTFTGTVSGITATMVGLGNVNNTSNATERAAVATLENKRIQPRVSSSASGDITPTKVDFDRYIRTAQAAAITISNPTMDIGEVMAVQLIDNATARAITFGTDYVGLDGLALPTTTTASKVMTMVMEKVTATKVLVSYVNEA